MADRALRFDLVGRDKSLGRTLKKGERDTERFRQRISGVGAAAGGAVVAGLAILGAGALKLASEFDDAYDTIRVATGKTGRSLDNLKKDFRAVVRDVPADFGDASTAVAELNRRTGQTGKPLQGLAKRMLELTRLTGGDLSTNIQLTTRLFGDWGIKTQDQAETLDKLFRAGQAAGVGIDALATSVVKFGAPLRQLGFSFDQSIALLAKFEKEGVNSSLVMSGMRIALGKLAKAGKDPQKGFLDLSQRIKDAGSSAAANRIAIEAFGQRAGPDMAAAIREGRLSIRDLQRQISGGKDTILGAARDAEDFGEKWKRVSNRLKLLAEPVVTKGLDLLSIKMGELEGFLTKNLIPKLDGLKTAWDNNKAAILGLLDPFDAVNAKSQTADERAQSLADSLATLTDGLGKVARGLENVERVLNETNASFQEAGNDIHVHFVRPMVRAFGEMALSFLKLNHKMIAGAATTAEALHLPMARGLRRAEQNMGRFVADARVDLDRLADKGKETADRVPGGARSGFGRSLGRAGKQTADFRGAFNRNIGALHGKRITIPIKGTFQPPKGFSLHSIVGATGGYVTPTAIVHRAQGGPIRMGTGPTADDVPAMLSRGEYVINAKATAKHRGLVEAINRDGLPGLARGGDVETGVKVPSMGRFSARIQQVVDTVGRRTAAALQKRLRVDLGGAIGGGSGPGGWQWQMRVLRAAFPGLALISGFRPGAITATGNRSYHSMGRAVDIPPRRDVFNWIRGTYGRNTRELIFSPAGNLQVHNGQNHMYTGVTRGDHWDHVHWAYDQGGWLMPGTTIAQNNTGRPERVLSPHELGPGVVVNVTVNGAVGHPRDVARALVPEIRQGLKEAQRRAGVPAREQVR